MRRMFWGCATVLLVAIGCSDDGDDDEAGSSERAEYVAALSDLTKEQGGFGDLSDEETDCVSGGYVDAVGLDDLSGVVSPEEMRDDPEAAADNWGLDLTTDQARRYYEAMRNCVELEALLAPMVASIGYEVDEGVVACLSESLDEDFFEEMMVETILQGDGYAPTTEVAGSYADWITGCLDIKDRLLSEIEGQASAEVLSCVDDRLDEDTVRDLLVGHLTGDEPVGTAFAALFAGCAGG